MAKGTSFKKVVVKEDSKTSLQAAGIHPLKLEDGTRIAVLAHMFFPYHDRSMFELVMEYLRANKPEYVFLLGGIVSEEAFKSLTDEEDNYLHDRPEVAEVIQAQNAGPYFEDKVEALGKICGEFIKSIGKATGGNVVYVPSATHLSMPNEVRLLEYIHGKKRNLDDWAANHPEASDVPSDPTRVLPRTLEALFGLTRSRKIKVLRHGAGILVRGISADAAALSGDVQPDQALPDDVLFMIGDFRRRNAGDSSWVEWLKRGVSTVRSFDGKVSSSWKSTAGHTLPGLTLNYWQAHEVGYLWDNLYMSHLRDYDYRAPGFWTGEMVAGVVDGLSVLIRRGNDGRRSFLVDGTPYTEEKAAPVFAEEIKF